MSNDTVNVQRGVVGAGSDDDTYILASTLIDANAQITISDVEGSNSIQLIGGLSITSSIVAEDTAQLTLSNGAVVTVLGASSMSYAIGGNPLTGEIGSTKTYQTFATDILGSTVPTTGTSNGGTSDINSDGTATVTAPAEATLLEQAQAKANTVATYGTTPITGDSPAVESGTYWTKSNITYSYSNTEPTDYADEGITGFIAFPDAAKTPSKASFDDIETFTALTFTEVASDGDIRLNVIGQSGGTDGYAYYPGDGIGGDIFLNNEYTTTDQYVAGGSPFFTVVHEVGHAMGLDHSFEGDGTLPTAEENTQHSVMSYTNVKNYSINFTVEGNSISSSPVIDHDTTGYSYYDVIGLQAAYGVNTTYNSTDTVYTVNFDTTTQEVIWDAGGTDTIDASSATGICTVDLRESKFSSIDVRTASEQATAKIAESSSFTPHSTFINEQYASLDSQNELFTGENNLIISKGVWIENAITGSANDTVQDNAVNNNITTGTGDDTILLTEGGFDTVDGGTGTDTVQFNVASTAATVEQQADGSYVVLGSTFGAQLTGVETLQFTDMSTTLA